MSPRFGENKGWVKISEQFGSVIHGRIECIRGRGEVREVVINLSLRLRIGW